MDAHALQHTPDWARASLQSLVDYLTEPAYIETDTQKARAIFRWVAHNIEYDDEAVHAGRLNASYIKMGYSDAEKVLERGKSVCSGYSFLVKALMNLAHIECVHIFGISKGEHYNMTMTVADLTGNGHGWNAVKLEGKWKLIDVTWAATSSLSVVDGVQVPNQSYDESWWCTDPATFLFKHFPEGILISRQKLEDDEIAWQLLDNPVTKEQWAEMPVVRNEFKIYGLSFTSVHQ